MARLRLLPGERELVRLRPTPGAWLGRYLLAALWAAWGAFVVSSLPEQFGLTPVDAPSLRNWLLPALIPLVPLVGAALVYATLSHWVRFGLCVAATVAFSVAAFATDVGLAVALAITLVALLVTETDRRMRTYHLTNLRVVHEGGLWEKSGWTVHYDAILDVDQRQGPLGRLFGYGTLEPVLRNPRKSVAAPTKRRKIAVPAMSDITVSAEPRLVRVGPVRKVRHLLTSFVQDATATAYLRDEQQTGRRVADAIRALGRANVLRR